MAARVKAYRRGVFAETLAAPLFRLKGYRIIASRYRTPVAEIDPVALKAKRLTFVEVKRRKNARRRSLDAARQAAAAYRARRAIIGWRAIPISPGTTWPSTWC
jgi:putative endonuclease